MIRRTGQYYYVYSKTGKRLGGPYKSLAEAKDRLKQIEYFKAKGKSK